MLTVKYSIGAKIFGAFVAMSLIIAALGVAGYAVLSATGTIAVTTFDGPLIAISYARAAHTDFAQMQTAELQLESAAPSQRPELAATVDELSENFNSDLGVAAERAAPADERAVIAALSRLFQQWKVARTRNDAAALQRLDGRIDAKFDLLIELITDHGFVSRRQTVSNIANYKYASVFATIIALLLAGAITYLLRSRIVQPLRAAALVADRIAQGELQTEIPAPGRDETGTLLKSLTVMQDSIREMMAREMTLRRSAENRLVDALETSREGVMLVAPDGRIALANGTLWTFFPAIAQSLVVGVHFDTALHLIQGQLRTDSTPQIDPAGESELQLADGRWLRMAASRTREEGSIVFFYDISTIKEREEKMRRAMQQAEAANAAKSRFLANMSHELRTPLNAIIGFSEILSSELFGSLGNARYLDYSHDILRSGRHLLDVINDVLALSKSDAGKMTLDARPLDMANVLDDCAAMMREQCVQAGLHFSMQGVEGPLPLVGDAAKLRQIFLNLLSNAVKFTEAGGTVCLEVRIAPPGLLVVTVSDTGIGMSAEDMEIAFQPFGQVDNRLERRYEGTGLGLPLTKALVELHEGTIGVDSARGRGTRVIVTFKTAMPLAQEAPLAQAM